jgi:hypothetical protein
LVGLAVQLRALGAEVRVCAPPDKVFASRSVAEKLGIPYVYATFCPFLLPSPHHGGAGTTTTAAGGGAPQVVVPQAVDEPYWAARVADLGIGAAHDGPTPTTESLSAALRTTLTLEPRARATAVAGTIRRDGATVAATLLVDAVSRERSPAFA